MKMNLYQAIMNMYPTLQANVDFVIYDDGTGAKIHSWNNANPQPTDDQLNTAWANVELQTAKDSKLAELNGKFEAVVAGGFSSSADGTARQYPLDPSSMIKWSGAMSVIDTNTITNPLIIKDINSNQVTVTPEQFKQMATDGFNYFMQQEQKLWQLEAQVTSCTDVPSVNAITWE